MKLHPAALVLLFGAALAVAPTLAKQPPEPIPTAAEILRYTIAFHDPHDAWNRRTVQLESKVILSERLAAERGYKTRIDRIAVNNATGVFEYSSEKGEDLVEVRGKGDTFTAKLNGTSTLSDADRATHGLTAERLPRLRNYFTYMFGLPMKLRDPGTILDPEVKRTEFEGKEVYALRVTYPSEIGKDIWYFYVDPVTYATLGCRFFHDEAKNDGEYIVFDGVVGGEYGLKLPGDRRWHMNIDGEQIAVDEILSVDGIGVNPMSVPENSVHYLEIVTPDIDAAVRFYGKAYGWKFGEPTPELGNARVASLPDGSLCGIRAPMRETEKPIVRTYLRVPDLKAAVQKAADLGATIALDHMELPGYGTIAIYIQGGVEQGLWQLPD